MNMIVTKHAGVTIAPQFAKNDFTADPASSRTGCVANFSLKRPAQLDIMCGPLSKTYYAYAMLLMTLTTALLWTRVSHG